MYDIAVAGNLKEILPFKGIGMKIYPMDELEKQENNRREIISKVFESNHKIIMVTEEYYNIFLEIYETKKSLKKKNIGILLSIHNGINIQNLGRNNLQQLVETAIGVDIFREKT